MKLLTRHFSCFILFVTLTSVQAISQEPVTEPNTATPPQAETAAAPEAEKAVEVPPGYDFTIETQIPCTALKIREAPEPVGALQPPRLSSRKS